jgi:hypothetical protein
MNKLYLFLFVMVLALSACVRQPAPDATTMTAGERSVPTKQPESTATQSTESPIMETNGLRHSVPLEQIIFDTFQPNNRAVPYPDITPERIEQLRDAIPPINEPKYVDAATGDWLLDTDLIIGYVAEDGTPYAFPTKILNFHEIVNTTLAGQPIAITYCPLCASAVVFDRRLGEQTLTLGNTSALYESGMVMVDNETDTYWYHVGGNAILGELTGERLELLPAVTTNWSSWLQAHPDTMVLSRDTGFRINYDNNVFYEYARRLDAGGFVFPVSDAALDDRLSPATVVLVVEEGDEALAFPLVELGSAATHATLGGRPMVIFSSQFGPTGAAFVPEADGRTLTFFFDEDGWRDEETGTLWSVDGLAMEGPLAGAQLPRVPSRYLFWFAAVASTPGIEVFGS